MLSLIFLLSISFFVSEASARNPKYEKMLCAIRKSMLAWMQVLSTKRYRKMAFLSGGYAYTMDFDVIGGK